MSNDELDEKSYSSDSDDISGVVKALKQRAKKEEYNKKRRKYVTKNKSMKGEKTKFSQVMFDKYDTPARKVLREKLGDLIKDNPDKYGQDFVIKSKKSRYKFLEVQVCANWTGVYKEPYVWIYERKARYLEKGDDTLFITLNRHLTEGFMFGINSIKKVKPRRIKKYSREFVYDIPWVFVEKLDMDRFDRVCVEYF